MRSLHILDNVPADRSSSRRRPRPPASRQKLKFSVESGTFPSSGFPGDESAARLDKALVVVESEGAVFDSLAFRHERGFLPAFTACFGYGVDPPFCRALWRALALESRLRGEDPLLILSAALKRLNHASPSLRRLSVSRSLDALISSDRRDPYYLAGFPEGSPERLILDWMAMADRLLEEDEYAPVFARAAQVLSTLAEEAPEAEILAYSTRSEAVALNQWEMAGLGKCFTRIAGRERGDLAAYLRTAMRNGYDSTPIVVVGTTQAAYQAAHSVGARFFPILPVRENEGWAEFSETYFPRFMRGEACLGSDGVGDFARLMLGDISSTGFSGSKG